jgi:hypothetical protein
MKSPQGMILDGSIPTPTLHQARLPRESSRMKYQPTSTDTSTLRTTQTSPHPKPPHPPSPPSNQHARTSASPPCQPSSHLPLKVLSNNTNTNPISSPPYPIRPDSQASLFLSTIPSEFPPGLRPPTHSSLSFYLSHNQELATPTKEKGPRSRKPCTDDSKQICSSYETPFEILDLSHRFLPSLKFSRPPFPSLVSYLQTHIPLRKIR